MTPSSPAGTAMPAPRPPARGGTRWWGPPASSTWWTARCAPGASDGRGTVGQLFVLPNSRNVIPGEVRFSVEFRHPDEAELARIAAQFPRDAGFIARDSDVHAGPDRACPHPRPAVRPGLRGAGAGGRRPARLPGARHRVRRRARRDLRRPPVVPTAMIFTPCRDGLSHNEAESIEPEQAEAGCQVLLEVVLARAGRAG